MKKSLVALAAAASLMMLAPRPAQAQWVVVDPTNLMQNILTVANTLEQISNQVKQLDNQAQSLTNEQKHLTGLGLNTLPELRTVLSATQKLLQQAQGLGFDLQAMDTQFQQLYPTSSAGAVPAAQMLTDTRKRWAATLEALRTATRVQSQAVQNFGSDDSALSQLVDSSQSAVGALQATQATNQLLALQVRQSMQAQQLQIAQDRAQALEQARQVAVHERARQLRQRFQGSGTPYTVSTVNFHGQP